MVILYKSKGAKNIPEGPFIFYAYCLPSNFKKNEVGYLQIPPRWKSSPPSSVRMSVHERERDDFSFLE